MLEDFLRESEPLRREFDGLAAVGVSIGGPLDPEKGIIYSPPHLPGWDEWPLRDRLVEELNLPVRVEHDAVACLLAEHIWGVARGTTHAVYLTAGTGCGAGALIDGRVLRGPAGQSTEVGHLSLTEDGPAVYGKKGSVEAFCSGTGIPLLARHMFADRFGNCTSLKEIVRLSNGGDILARQVLRRSAWGMGRVCALFSDLFAPEVIIIGSLAAYLPAWWLDAVREEWKGGILSRHGRAKILPADLGERLQDLSSVAACVFAEAGLASTL